MPKGAIHLRTTAEIARRARAAEVVYTTGMFGRSSAGAIAARTPYVVKLTADPAFERARRRGVVGGGVDAFQALPGNAFVWLLRRARDIELRRAAHIFTPSAYLGELAVSWGVRRERISVLPNPSPPVSVNLPFILEWPEDVAPGSDADDILSLLQDGKVDKAVGAARKAAGRHPTKR